MKIKIENTIYKVLFRLEENKKEVVASMALKRPKGKKVFYALEYSDGSHRIIASMN